MAEGAATEKRCKNGDIGYLHRLNGERISQARPDPPSNPSPQLLDIDQRDQVYRALLHQLTLSAAHKEQLLARGYDATLIDSRLFRSMPGKGGRPGFAILQPLRGRFGDATLLAVPGIVCRESRRTGKPFLTLAGMPNVQGLLIPMVDPAGRIAGCQIRLDEPRNGDRYIWWTSKSKKHDGPSPGTPAHLAKAGAVDLTRCRLTEGPLKADLATRFSGVATVAVPGVSQWPEALPVLESVSAKTVVLAFDADSSTNKNVARYLAAAHAELVRRGFAVELEEWDAADGKGIDDLLAAGKQPRLLTGADVEAAIRQVLQMHGEDAGQAQPPTALEPIGPQKVTDPLTTEEVTRGLLGLVPHEPGDAVRLALRPEILAVLVRLRRERPGELEAFLLQLGRKQDVRARDVEALRRTINQEARMSARRSISPENPPPGAGHPVQPATPASGVREDIDDPHRLARSFLLAHPNSVVYFRECFHLYCGTHWESQRDAEFRAVINNHCKAEIDRASQAANLGNEPVVKVTTSLVCNVLQALSGCVLLPTNTPWPAWLDDHAESRNWIALQNGILDTDAFLSGQKDCLRPHDPHWFSPVCLPYRFDPAAECPRWNAFLCRNFADDSQKAALLQQWAGYCLLPDTSLQKALFMVGEGSNGKSVVCAAFSAMLGAENLSTVPLEFFGEKFRLVSTLGKLVNMMFDVGEVDKAAEGFIKAFIVGDSMDFEVKFRQPFTARPTARVMLATNNMPKFSDRSDGIWRRILSLPFAIQIPEEEKIPRMDKPEWWAEHDELPGVFNWALEGLRVLRQQGRFTVPESCDEALKGYRLDSNPARKFVLEHYEINTHAGPGEGLPKSEVYTAYKKWSSDNGHKQLASNSFGQEVFRAFKSIPQHSKVKNLQGAWVNGYPGLILKGGADVASPDLPW